MTLTDSGPRGPEYGPARLKRLVFNLLYPAVLGTFFVSLLPAAVGSLRSGFHLKTVLCILIVSHFVIDYLFSEEVRDYRAFTFRLSSNRSGCLEPGGAGPSAGWRKAIGDLGSGGEAAVSS